MNTNQYVQTTPNSTLLSSIYPTIQPNKSFTPLELLLSSSMYYILNVLKKNTSIYQYRCCHSLDSPWNSLSCFTNTLPSSQQYKFLLDDKLVQCSMYHKEKDIYVTVWIYSFWSFVDSWPIRNQSGTCWPRERLLLFVCSGLDLQGPLSWTVGGHPHTLPHGFQVEYSAWYILYFCRL